MLIDRMRDLVAEACQGAFAQRRSQTRAAELSVATLCSYGRRTVSRAICALGRQHQDWSADYKLYSRSPWQAERLFDPVFDAYAQRYPAGPVVVGFDDTKLPKTGRHIASAFWQRDPLSPPFHTNLVFGLRFMQASLIFPHYQEGDWPARGVPVRFVECPAVKKPGKRATDEQRKAYREAVRTRNLSTQSLAIMNDVRRSLDAAGMADRAMLSVTDGSLCNRTFFRTPLDRVDILGRCRKDARLCMPAPADSRRQYDARVFTPEQVRKDEALPWRQTRAHFGGAWREVKHKEISGVLWRRGAGTRPLRLIVLAPCPYKTSPNAAYNYRQPAYLLTTDLTTDAAVLIQAYLDRWQIEVNHREEKDTLGVGQSQVWAPQSVPRQPAFAVAAYSLLLVAAMQEFGPGRTEQFLALPKWRRKAKRPSALDLITLLRKEMGETSVCDSLHRKFTENATAYAYT